MKHLKKDYRKDLTPVFQRLRSASQKDLTVFYILEKKNNLL